MNQHWHENIENCKDFVIMKLLHSNVIIEHPSMSFLIKVTVINFSIFAKPNHMDTKTTKIKKMVCGLFLSCRLVAEAYIAR